jgi:hypothetical protein
VAAAVYDWLLFLHVLAAFLLVGTVVVYSAVVLGAPAPARTATVANVFWAVGGLGTIILGIALAIDVDGYEVWDGWILGAIVLWAAATELGRRAQAAAEDPAERGKLAQWHWLRTIVVVAILVLMIWKPGA